MKEIEIQKRKFVEKELHQVLNDVDNPTDDGKRRIQDKIISLSMWGAFMTRGGKRVYKENITVDEKIAFKRVLSDVLFKIKFDNCIDDDLVDKIKSFTEEISRRCGNSLNEARFRIGISQKLINLYLKYQWCLGWSPEPPPHCPLDGQVIVYLQKNVSGEELKEKIKNIRWTKMDSIEDYQNLVKTAEIVSKNKGCKSIAEWELKFWNEKNV